MSSLISCPSKRHTIFGNSMALAIMLRLCPLVTLPVTLPLLSLRSLVAAHHNIPIVYTTALDNDHEALSSSKYGQNLVLIVGAFHQAQRHFPESSLPSVPSYMMTSHIRKSSDEQPRGSRPFSYNTRIPPFSVRQQDPFEMRYIRRATQH